MKTIKEAFKVLESGEKIKPAVSVKSFNCKYLHAIQSGEDAKGKPLFHYLNDRNEAAGPDSFGLDDEEKEIVWEKYKEEK